MCRLRVFLYMPTLLGLSKAGVSLRNGWLSTVIASKGALKQYLHTARSGHDLHTPGGTHAQDRDARLVRVCGVSSCYLRLAGARPKGLSIVADGNVSGEAEVASRHDVPCE